MAHLPHRAYDRVSGMLPELYSLRDVPAFLETAVHLMSAIVKSDGVGWFIYRLGVSPKLVAFAEQPRVIQPWVREAMEVTASGHPFMAAWQRLGAAVPLSDDDVPRQAMRRFQDKFARLHNEIGRHCLTTQVTTAPPEVNAVSFRSYRRAFNDEDRAVVSFLRPHLERAFLNAQLVSGLMRQAAPVRIEFAARLTPRETDVAFWIAQGKTSREIGLILGHSMRTAEKHTENILRKLGLENRTALAIQFSRTPKFESCIRAGDRSHAQHTPVVSAGNAALVAR